jgi:sigma-B regulation protein RsbU (phosphoserine phosphatase)
VAPVNPDSPQAELASVLDSLPDSYFEADVHGTITYANRAFYEHLGYDDRSAVVGRNFRRFTDSGSVRQLYLRFGELYQTKAPVQPFRYYFRPLHGPSRPGEISISPILNGDAVVGTRGLIRDVSSHMAAEQELREAKESAEARAARLRALNRVAATVGESLDIDRVLQAICEELTSVFPVRNAGVALITPDRQNLEVVAFHSPDPDETSALGLVLPFAGNPSSQEVIRTRKPLVLQDAQSDPRSGTLSDISRARGTRAIMIVPILSRGEAIGTVGMPARDPYYIFTDGEIELAETIASQIATAIDNARLHSQTESALSVAERDLEIGREIQSGFFPVSHPETPGWELAAQFKAARQVAGDFYDSFSVAGTRYVAIVIADVCDKGVGAALFMVLFRSLIRAFSLRLTDGDSPGGSLERLVQSTNDFVAEYHGRSNMFATMFVGLLDPQSGLLRYVNGGHEPPVIIDATGSVVCRLAPTGPAVGMLPGSPYAAAEHRFSPGECLVGFTDGTTDARNASGEIYGEGHLLSCLSNPWTSLFSMLFELDLEIKHHIGEEPQFDDITLIAVRRKLETAAPADHAICRPARLEYVPEVRDFVEQAALNESLAHDHVLACKSSVDEVCTNIVEHGYAGGDPGLLSVRLVVEPDVQLVLTISDDGKHFPPEDAESPDIEAALEQREMGGLGLYLVRAQMDRVTYRKTESGHNELVLELDLKPTQR